MAILRCNHCGYIREVSNEHVGKTVKCPVCERASAIYDTVDFVKKLIDKYGVLLAKYREVATVDDSADAVILRTDASLLKDEDVDLHNTVAMTNSMQYKPIISWFERKNVQVEVNHKALDTQGFYDEVAVELGDQFAVLQDVLDKIRRAQRNNYSSVVLNLNDHSQSQIKIITGFCKNLYEYAFVSKYFYNKNDKRVHLTLQNISAIVGFFNGEWLEWYVFMKLLKYFYDSKGLFSCLRSFNIQFANDDKYEVDVFFLINGHIPVFIECKAGEFRPFIDKYSKMRRRLDIDKANFLLLVLGVSDEQVSGLSKMHDITFVNELGFLNHIQALVAK